MNESFMSRKWGIQMGNDFKNAKQRFLETLDRAIKQNKPIAITTYIKGLPDEEFSIIPETNLKIRSRYYTNMYDDSMALKPHGEVKITKYQIIDSFYLSGGEETLGEEVEYGN